MPDDPRDRDDRLAAAVAELYEASPEDFTARRGELAAAAREAGDRPAAKAISALRRPTRAAWVVNRLARDDPGAPRRLAELAAALNAAQQAGHGPRLRELSAARWALIDTLTAQALAAARLADPPPSLRLEVAQTITAALGDPGVAADFAAGTLTRAAQWSGFGLAPEGASGGADARPAAVFGAQAPGAEPADGRAHGTGAHGTEVPGTEAAGAEAAAVPPQRRAPGRMTERPRTGRAPAVGTEPAAGRGGASGSTARERTAPVRRAEVGGKRAAPRAEPGGKREARPEAGGKREAARPEAGGKREAARPEAGAERKAARPEAGAEREAGRSEAAASSAAVASREVARRAAAEREAREATERADRRRQQYEEAERTVATAAAAAADAVAAEDRLETEVRDLEQRLTRARAELATVRMRARHAETAERRARQAFDRMPGQ